MIGWSGRRKTLTILAFILPTLLGILVFSVYPFIFNVFISVTDRGKFHPNPDCSQPLWSIVEPTCWLSKEQRGLATPFAVRDPWYQNYTDLIGGLFQAPGPQSLLRIAIAAIPLVGAWYVNRRLSKGLTRPVPGWVVWLAGLALAVIIGLLIDVPDAYDSLVASGDFIMVNVRTILYVLVCMPLFFITGLAMALILNNQFLRGVTFFRVVLIVPWAASTVAIMMSLVWQFFFRGQGTINQILNVLNI
ncbi:MAG: sugar ABC transporter permease, partial [Anaerolineae bacterium]